MCTKTAASGRASTVFAVPPGHPCPWRRGRDAFTAPAASRCQLFLNPVSLSPTGVREPGVQCRCADDAAGAARRSCGARSCGARSEAPGRSARRQARQAVLPVGELILSGLPAARDLPARRTASAHVVPHHRGQETRGLARSVAAGALLLTTVQKRNRVAHCGRALFDGDASSHSPLGSSALAASLTCTDCAGGAGWRRFSRILVRVHFRTAPSLRMAYEGL
jgi:hypothetical protein